MNAEELEIARRLVACKGWEWLEGMQVVWCPEACDGRECESECRGMCADAWYRLCFKDKHEDRWGTPYHTSFVEWDRNRPETWDDWLVLEKDGSMVPDLSDDMTRLGVLAVVRRAWGDKTASVRAVDCYPLSAMWTWIAGQPGVRRVGHERTELGALLAALEAAP